APPHPRDQIKWRERQRFFEEVFQHDMDVYLSSTHLQIEHRRPPVGSISSMEVNIDMLEQMELLEISDQEALDVFLNSSGEDGTLDSPLTGTSEVYKDELLLEVPRSRCETKSRMSSTSSGSTDPYSLDTSEEGTDTPIVQSDDEEGQTEALLLKPNGAEEKSKNTHSS
uniref:Si:ch211-253b8.5 n=1 Tax=Scleropages formosus TaxID=113540 RepID=A0A8C9SIU9_SCLFO